MVADLAKENVITQDGINSEIKSALSHRNSCNHAIKDEVQLYKNDQVI